jgi:hypothetical protein
VPTNSTVTPSRTCSPTTAATAPVTPAAGRAAISRWLSPSARAWRQALAPLDPAQRRMVIDTLLRFEAAVESEY